MPVLLALDQGTSSSRAIVFDTRGRALAIAQREFHQSYPQPGWVEHDPLEIWRTQLDCARLALAESRHSARDVAAIGIANQRETTVLWDRHSGQPLAPAIVWQDRRTADACARLNRAVVALADKGRKDEVADLCKQIDEIESKADRVQRKAISQLFDGSASVWTAMKLREFYALQEEVLDRCEDAAKTIEEILIENS